jgi:hypothetical protein
VTVTHPRYTGQVLDAHCHYDGTTAHGVERVLDGNGIAAAIHFWAVEWPPPDFEAEGRQWGAPHDRLHRCHVPDLSGVGRPGAEAEMAERLRAAAAAGAVGVKLWKNLGLWLRDAAGERLAVNDPRLAAIWDTAADLGLAIVIHQGDAPAFFAPLDESNPRLEELRARPEWWYGGGGFPSLEQIQAELEETVAANPRTTFVGLHFGCFMRWSEVGRMLDEYENYNIDTATAIADMGREDSWQEVREIIVGHPDRVVFGSDLIRTKAFDLPGPGGGWGPGEEYEGRWDLTEFFDRHWAFFETDEDDLDHPLTISGDWKVHGLDLPDAVLSQRYGATGRRLFGLAAG